MARIVITLEDTPQDILPFTVQIEHSEPPPTLEPPTEVQRLAFDFEMAVQRILSQRFEDEDDEPTDIDDPTDTWEPT